MSDGRNFSKIDKDLSPEDRLTEVERKFSAIVDRIQQYDKVLEEFSVLNQNLASFSELKKEIKDSQLQICTKHDNLEKYIASSIESFSSIFYKSIKKNSDMAVQQSEQIKYVDDFGSKIKKYVDESFRLIFLEIEKFSEKTDIEKVRSEFSAQLKDIFISIASFSSSVQKISEKTEEFHKVFDSIHMEQGEIRGSIESIKDQILIMNKSFSSHISALESNIEISAESVRREWRKELDLARDEILGSPSSNESVRREILTKLQSVVMDSSNAVLKSGNVEAQVKLLEKKIENAFILMKKYEITK